MKKKSVWLSFVPLLIIILLAFFFYRQSLTQAGYEGLPTVPCRDYTKPVIQSYSFHISISIMGKPYPIPKTYGHDYGQCLHDIFAKDSSGTIYIKTNEPENFDLGNFFDVWRANFSRNQIFGYQTANGHTLTVYMNGQKIQSFRETPLFPNTEIKIIYQ